MKKRVRKNPPNPKLVAFIRRKVKSGVTHANWDEWHRITKAEGFKAPRDVVQDWVFYALQQQMIPEVSGHTAKLKADDEAIQRDLDVERQWSDYFEQRR